MSKCEATKNVEIGGEKYKVVNPEDPCSSVNKVLAKHEGSTILTPTEYEAIMNRKVDTD